MFVHLYDIRSTFDIHSSDSPFWSKLLPQPLTFVLQNLQILLPTVIFSSFSQVYQAWNTTTSFEIISPARYLIDPDLSPQEETCICAVSDNKVNSPLRWDESSLFALQIHVTAGKSILRYLLKFFSRLPPQYAASSSWQQAQLWHRNWN